MANDFISEETIKTSIRKRHCYIDLTPISEVSDFADKTVTRFSDVAEDRSKKQSLSIDENQLFSSQPVNLDGWRNPDARVVSRPEASIFSPRVSECPRYLRSLRSLIPAISCYIALLVCGLAVSVLLSSSVIRFQLSLVNIRLLGSIPLGLIPSGVYLVIVIRRIYDTYLEMGVNHIRLIQGRCSFRMRRTEIGYDSVAFVSVIQSLSDRLLRVGTVKIGRYNDEEAEISLDGVSNPHRLSKMIKATLENRNNYRFVATAS